MDIELKRITSKIGANPLKKCCTLPGASFKFLSFANEAWRLSKITFDQLTFPNASKLSTIAQDDERGTFGFEGIVK